MPSNPFPRRWARWLLVGLALVAIVATPAMFLAPRPVTVEAANITRGPISETLADQGFARVREAYSVSSPIAGQLKRIDLHVGDYVEANKTIVARVSAVSSPLLDARSRSQAEAAVNSAQAAVRAAEAQRDLTLAESRKADADLARTSALAAKGFASNQALDSADALSRSARASVRAAEAEVGVRRADLKAARAALIGPDAASGRLISVLSPASGHVTRVLQESERAVSQGAPLVEISDRQGLEAAIEFRSQDAVRIAEGMPAAIYDWGGPEELPAVVRRVEPQAFTKVSALGVEEQRVLVLLQFTGPQSTWARLAPGYRVWGRVILRTAPDALKAPVGALVRKDGGWAVFVIEGDRARLRPVRIGAITDREVEVLAGVRAGEKVVVFPSDKVRDGGLVRARR